MVGWALLLDYVFLPMINYLVVGLYMQDYFPSTPQALWVIVAIALVTALNILGVRLVAGMNFIFIAAQLIFIVVFVALSIAEITSDADAGSFSAPFVGSGLDPDLVLGGAAILALSFLGFDAVSTLSEETRDPRRRIPRAIILCALFGGLVYVVQSYLGHLAFPDWRSVIGREDVTSADVMTFIGGDFLNSFFTAVYISSAFAWAMASQASVARILYAMGRDGSLRRTVFARLHPAVPDARGGEPDRGRARVHRALHQPRDRVADDQLRRPGGILLRQPRRGQDLRRRPRERSTAGLVKFGLLPFIGFAFTLYLWTQLTELTFEIGLGWVAAGFLYLLVLTRMFRRPPPEMYSGDEEGDELVSAPARA